jgi:hypothetical protein
MTSNRHPMPPSKHQANTTYIYIYIYISNTNKYLEIPTHTNHISKTSQAYIFVYYPRTARRAQETPEEPRRAQENRRA